MRFLIACFVLLLCTQAYCTDSRVTGFSNNPGVALFEAAEYASAEQYFVSQLTPQSPNYELALVYLAKLSILKNNGMAAVQHSKKFLAISPNSAAELMLAAEAHCTRALQVSIFSALKQGRKCGALYDEAATNYPDNIKALKTAIQFHLEAPTIAGGSMKSAKKYLQQLDRISEEDARAMKLAVRDKENGEQEAFLLANQYSEMSFSKAENIYDLALFYRDKKSYKKAEYLLNRILTHEYNDTNNWHKTDALFQLGELYILNGTQVQAGILLIEQYTRLSKDIYEPHYFWSRWRLARTYRAQGNEEKYKQLIALLQATDYSHNIAFAKEFKAAIK